MWPPEVIVDEYNIIDPLGRGPKRRQTSPLTQMRSPPPSSNRDVAFQVAVSGIQPMFPDAAFNKASPPPPPQHAPPPARHRSMQSDGEYQTRQQPYDLPTPPPPRSTPHHEYENAPIPPSPMQVYSMRQAPSSSHSNHSHSYGTGGSQNAYAVSGYSSHFRNIETEERDPPPQTSSYDPSGSFRHHHHHHLQQQQQHHHHHQYQPPQYQSPHLAQYSSHINHNYVGEREQQQPPQHRHQYHRHDDYNRGLLVVNSDPSPPRREHHHHDSNIDYPDRLSSSENNRQSYASTRPQHEFHRVPHPNNPQRDHQYYHDSSGHHHDRLSRSEHDRHYSPPRPREYGPSYSSPRECHREATYEEQTSPLSIPSFVGGPPESNNENNIFVSPPFTSPQQFSSPHHHYPKETINGGRRSVGSQQYRQENYYSPPPESRDDYTGSSTIQTSSPPMHHGSHHGYHHSHSHGHGEYYPENLPRPHHMRGYHSVNSIDSTLPNRTHPSPVRPNYNNINPTKQSPSSLPNKMIPRYHQAEDNRRQSQARTQILKEIKQATKMKNSAMDENDRKFWERQIATLNASFRKL